MTLGEFKRRNAHYPLQRMAGIWGYKVSRGNPLRAMKYAWALISLAIIFAFLHVQGLVQMHSRCDPSVATVLWLILAICFIGIAADRYDAFKSFEEDLNTAIREIGLVVVIERGKVYTLDELSILAKLVYKNEPPYGSSSEWVKAQKINGCLIRLGLIYYLPPKDSINKSVRIL